MENNEIMNNEEVMETATEEIVKATSNSSCLSSVTKIGLARNILSVSNRQLHKICTKSKILRTVYG